MLAEALQESRTEDCTEEREDGPPETIPNEQMPPSRIKVHGSYPEVEADPNKLLNVRQKPQNFSGKDQPLHVLTE